MSKKLTKKKIENVKKTDYFTLQSTDGTIRKVIFPSDVQIGIKDSEFTSTISGSIHHTHEGKSYLVAGPNITISSASNGQITITGTAGSAIGTVTSVSVGTGLDVTSPTSTPYIQLDLSEITTSTDDADGDFFVVVNDSSIHKKLTKGNINLSGFNNDSGFVTENTMGAGFILEDNFGTEVAITENKEIKLIAGTGLEIVWTDTSDGTDADPYDLNFAVDVSDFMSNGENNRVLTAGGTDSINAESNLTFDGSILAVTGSVLPGIDNTYDLGSSSKAWRNAYFEGDINFSNTSEIDVAAGDLTIDVAGDITLDADGDQIYFKAAGTERYRFNLDVTPQIDVTGDFTIDGTGTMTFNADGGSIEMKDGTSGTHFLFDMNNTALTIFDDTNANDYIKIAVDTNGSSTISTFDNDGLAGNLTLDVDGDIILDADGSTIDLNDNGTNRFKFNLGTTPELDVVGSFILDVTSDITLDSGGGQIYLKDDGVDHFLFDMDNTELTIYDDTSTNDYLKFKVDTNGASTISTNHAAGTSGNLTLQADGSITLSSETGDINFIDGSSATIFNFDLDNSRFRMRDDVNTANYFDIQVTPNGGVTLTTVDSVASNGSLVATIDGLIDLNATGDITLDATGNIVLSADGDQIIMDDGQGNTRFTFNLDATPELDVNGDFTIDCGGDIIIDAGGGQIDFKDGGANHFLFDMDNTSMSIYDDTNSNDYFRIQVNADGSTTLSTYDNDGAAGNMTLTADGDINIDAAGADINFKSGVFGTKATLNVPGTGNVELDVFGGFVIDADGDITLDADGGQIYFKDGGVTRLTHDISNSSVVSVETSAGSAYAITGSGIILNATDTYVPQIVYKHNGTTTLYHNINTTGGTSTNSNSAHTIAAAGNITLDADGDIHLDANGNEIYFKDNGNTFATFSSTYNTTNGMFYLDSNDSAMSSNQKIMRIDSADTSMDSSNYWIAFTQNGNTVGGITSGVTYGTFTGNHPGVKLSGSLDYRLGSVVKSTGNVIYRSNPDIDISNAWIEFEITTTAKDKAVVGVYSGLWDEYSSFVSGSLHCYNALGEGMMLVTDENGNIEVGDYICSSNRAGHGMKQDSDSLKNYTVGKANETIDFSKVEIDDILGFKSKLIACTYHCG